MPLRFVAESATEGPSPGFLAHNRKYSVDLTKGQCRISSSKTALAMRFSTTVDPVNDGPVESRINSFVGKDANSWRTGMPAYSSVRYPNVSSGVDLSFYGSEGENGPEGELEFDFRVSPGASLAGTRFEVQASGPLHLESDGLHAGDLLLKQPVAYQVGHSGIRVPIACRYLLKRNTVTFDVASYDHRLPLVIDPVLTYSTFLGGEENEGIRAIAADLQGNIYVAGATSSGNLPTSASSFQPAFAGGLTASIQAGDAFVAKFNGANGSLMWLTYLGGSGNEFAAGLAVDPAGNVYVTGMTNSTNFPTTAGAIQSVYHGGGGNFTAQAGDAFVAKLDTDGSKLIYSTYLGGKMDDEGLAIAVDATGNAYVTGATLSSDFPATAGALQTKYGGTGGQPTFGGGGFPVQSYVASGDAFVAKLNPTGTSLIYCTYLGGSLDDGVSSIAVDASGNAYIGGATVSSNFPTTAGAFQTRYKGLNLNQPIGNTGDAFVAKLNAAGSALIYSTLLGGSGDDAIMGLVIDGNGNAYVSGFTSSTDFPVTSAAYQKNFKGPAAILPVAGGLGRAFVVGDAFAAKINPQGSALLYATLLGGTDDDSANGIAIDSEGNAYIAGNTNSNDFPVTSAAIQGKFGGSGGKVQPLGDAFLVKLDPAGATLTYSTFLGGSSDDGAGGIVIDPSGNVWIAGATVSGNFPLAGGSQQTAFGGTAGTSDSFVSEITGLAAPVTNGPVIAQNGMVGAGLSTPRVTALSQNSIVSVFGQGFAAAGKIYFAKLVDGSLATNLGGTCVRVNGNNSPLFYVSATQINFQAPELPGSGTVPAQVVTNCGGSESVSNTATLSVQTATPEFFYFVNNSTGVNPIAGSDYTANAVLGAPGSIPGVTTVAAKPGDLVILYATGLGPTVLNLAPGTLAPGGGAVTGTLSVSIGGVKLSAAQIQYAGVAPTFAGLYQLNLVVPNLGSGKQPVVVSINGIASPPNAYIDVAP
jgi:uncharacterized protein (TIGR03437 family)